VEETLAGALARVRGDEMASAVVAALAAMVAIDAGWQCALMAPTEILAGQHFGKLVGWLEPLGIRVAWLTGSQKKKERLAMLALVASGEAALVVGTHAIIQEQVQFKNLGLAVIDEQHRFGVEHRAKLRDKSRAMSDEACDPDLLVMTATPIPRTAAMVLFGDLDRSVLDELPSGRIPIQTKWAVTDDEVAASWQLVRDEVAAGRRAYVVCPLVEGSDRVEAASAVNEHLRLMENELHGLAVGLLHGQMKGPEKDSVMEQFRQGDLDVLGLLRLAMSLSHRCVCSCVGIDGGACADLARYA
jgi:ATP-dependent DNA helicase RecG